MILVTTATPAKKKVTGEETLSVANGVTLVIETTPGGAETLSATPPPGKRWENVKIFVDMDEVDV